MSEPAFDSETADNRPYVLMQELRLRDRPGLVGNLGGDAELAGTVVERLIQLMATVSPGAKRGSTAPMAGASLDGLVDRLDRTAILDSLSRTCAASSTSSAMH